MKTVNLRPHLKRNILIAAVLLLVCAAVFWLTAALIQPVEAQPGTVAAFEMQ